MIEKTRTERRWWKWFLLFGCWMLLALFFTTQLYFGYYYTRYPISWRRALVLSLTDWGPWALLSPFILSLARRFPIERRQWLRGLSVHFAASLLVTIVKLMLEASAVHLFYPQMSRPVSPVKFHPNLLTYWAVVGVSHAIEYYRKYRERELRASRLEARLAQAQLEVLQMQLHPHFLFNTLHAISALMHRDVEEADRMLARLTIC